MKEVVVGGQICSHGDGEQTRMAVQTGRKECKRKAKHFTSQRKVSGRQ